MTALWPLLWKWLGGWLIDRIRRKVDPEHPKRKAEACWEKIQVLNEKIQEVTNQLATAMRNDNVRLHKSRNARRLRFIRERDRLARRRQHYAGHSP